MVDNIDRNKKITAVFVIFIMLVSSLLIIGPFTQNAEASLNTSTFSLDSQGFIERSGDTWTWMETWSYPNYYEIIKVGTPDGKTLSRQYLSFNVSSIPDNAYITSASLKMKCDSMYEGPADVNIYVGDWGTSRTSADWGCGRDRGYFMSTLSNTAYGTTYYVAVTPTLIPVEGKVQFEITLTDESPEDTSIGTDYTEYQLSVTYGSIDSMTYVMDNGDLNALNTVPTTWAYNTTHSVAEYEFDTYPGVRDVIIPIPSEWTFLTFTPYTNYTVDSKFLNITDVHDSVTYRVYFTYLSTGEVSVHLSTFVSSTGQGLAFETFRMKYSIGLTYNASQAFDVSSANFFVDYGEDYTVAVLDYYNNVITTQSFVANSMSKYISIPIDINSLKMTNQRSNFVNMKVYYENNPVPVAFFLAPGETYEKNLITGNYTIVTEIYNNHNVINGTKVNNIYLNDSMSFEVSGETMVYLAYFDATGTHPGEGLEWTKYEMYVDGVYLPNNYFSTNLNETHTLIVKDFFGNELFNNTITPTEKPLQQYNIAINTYSFKFINAQSSDPVLIKVWFNGTNAGYQSTYVGPGETVERFFKNGDYIFNVVYYSGTDVETNNAYYFKQINNNASYMCIREDGIVQELIETINGIEWQVDIPLAYTPDIVAISYNLPTVSGEPIIYIHPWSIVTADTVTTGVGEPGNGYTVNLYTPYPNVNNTEINTTIISDRIMITGQVNTRYWVNTTSGVTLFSGTVLPAYIDVAGQNITVTANGTISVHRDTSFRQEQMFYFKYYTIQKKYEVVLNINNTMGYLTMNNVNWFVGFPENRTIDTNTVKVFDLDNVVDLINGQNYEVSSSGIRLSFDAVDAAEARSMKFTFYDKNATATQDTASISIITYDTAKLDDGSYFHFMAQWTNPYAASYSGNLIVKLNFENAENIDDSSIKVFDRMNNKYLQPSEYTLNGKVLTIEGMGVGIGEVRTYEVYFKIDMAGADNDLLKPWFYIGSYGINIIWAVFLAALIMTVPTGLRYTDRKLAVTLVLYLITAILFILQAQGKL